ncbi:MAG: ABC transporter ATP-binding protein [Clostridiales bacterium]|nr:ABC transporter ATP-binding protein [Clostridiales bacterium]MDY5514099.1 ABC transporter ATP-binding protein [Candidatus Ventricola sp.]
MIEVSDLRAGYGGREVLHSVGFTLADGENLAVLGPNGCGKTTLLRTLAGLLPFEGTIRLDGKPLSGMRPLERAARVGLMSQTMQIPFDYTVREVVRMGRYRLQRRAILSGETEADERAAEEAMRATGLLPLADRRVTALSGGQQQRVFLSRVLAQEPAVILLDEPTNHLDLRSQLELLDYLKAYSETPGRQVVGVFHDLTLAPRLCGRALFLEGGAVRGDGAFSKIATPAFLQTLYGVDVRAHLEEALAALPRAQDAGIQA